MSKINSKDRNHRRLIFITIILLVSLIGGCGNKLNDQGIVKTDKDFEVIKPEANSIQDIKENSVISMNQMGLEIFKEMAINDQQSNQLFSPTSLGFALAILQNGAEGETKQGILNVLLEDETDMNDRYNIFMNYLTSLDNNKNSDDTGLKLRIANSLWIKEGLTPKQAFVDSLNEYYNAQVFQKDFEDSKTIKDMNIWVENQTNKMLKETIKQLDTETVALLMNTIYFKGTWKSDFSEEATKKEAFYSTKSKSSFIDTMNKTELLPYFEDKLCQMTSLSYYGGSSMVIVLPKGDIDYCLVNLNSQTIEEISDYMQNNEERVKLSLPKLDIEVSHDLKEVLRTQGMEKAFSPSEANFQSMMEIKSENIYVNSILQNTRIIVDENGTEAAAVTAVEIAVTSAMKPSEPIIFACNKPFIYLIRDDKSGAILFVGVVREP